MFGKNYKYDAERKMIIFFLKRMKNIILSKLAAENVLDSLLDEEELSYEETYYLPVLYNTDKSGKERIWKIWVSGNTIHRIQGLTDGKKQTYQRKCQGKNIGKKNETTPQEQAKLVAETTWIDQLDKGYLPKCDEGKLLIENIKKSKIETGGHNINASAAIRGRQAKTVTKKESHIVNEVFVSIKPMKAGTWEHEPNNPRKVLPKTLKYFDTEKGFYMQYKLDGYRCIARLQKEGKEWKCVMTTNNTKQYAWFNNLRKQITRFILETCDNPTDIILDGELYSHTLIDAEGNETRDESRFSIIQSICSISRTEPHILEDQIQYTVFDLVDLSGKQKQSERMEKLLSLFDKKPKDIKNIVMCNTKIGYSPEDVINYHDEASQKGFEGVIIRSMELVYIQKRSLFMRKYKHFIDAEYTIVDVEKDGGVSDENFVWVCEDPSVKNPKTNKPVRFKAKPATDREAAKEWYQNYVDYIGRKATVRFQEFSQDNIPRFPRVIGFRDDQ